MAVKIPETDNAGLNMTPMIDIVFQLILFFLFNLRFKSLDYRIESSLPKLADKPSLIVWGLKDRAFRKAQLERWKKALPIWALSSMRRSSRILARAFTRCSISAAGGRLNLICPCRWVAMFSCVRSRPRAGRNPPSSS